MQVAGNHRVAGSSRPTISLPSLAAELVEAALAAGRVRCAWADERPARQDRLDGVQDDARNGEQQADLRVRQRQFVADQRPGGVAAAEDELVEKLDRQQRRHDAAERPPDQESPGRMRRLAGERGTRSQCRANYRYGWAP
jgi:hypothetical protein